MEAPKIRLLGDRVLVSVIKEEEQKTAGGLIIPTGAESEEKALVGKVLSVSKRVENCEVEEDKVSVGEKIIFSKYAGSDVKYNNKDYKVLRITDIFGAEEE